MSAIEVNVGDQRVETLVENLTRTQFVMYAGASGDYNPIHTDEVFATQVGNHPTVFAHGMLIMGMASRAVGAWFGTEAVTSFGTRFVRQVWPGDTLVATTEVTAVDEAAGTVTLSLQVRNQSDEVVLAGDATARLVGRPLGSG